MIDRPVCPFVVDMLFRPPGKPMGQSDANLDNQAGLQVNAPVWCREAVRCQPSPARVQAESRSSPIQCNAAMLCNAIRPNPGRSSSMTWIVDGRGGSRSTVQAEGASI
jgi:hypothetical protein